MKHLSTIVIILSAAALFLSFDQPKKVQRDYPQGYFQNPVQHSLRLSGTFGELRPNHFHSGVDITPARSGVSEPIYAAAEGYVSRIKIAPSGYGNALYITHPNGFVTVYGHLDKYESTIAAFARRKQYEQQVFELDYTPAPNELPIARGQQIGMMGNTGNSFGVHLHFEIRDAATEETINPILFGIAPADHVAPSMQGLKIYLLNEKNEVFESRFVSITNKGDRNYGISESLNLNAARVAFALKTFDRHDGDSGENGVFSIETQRDDQTVHRFVAERFRFDETKYLNAHLDYGEQVSRKSLLNRLWRMSGNQLSMYESEINAGIIDLSSGAPSRMRVTARDAVGNAATLEFSVAGNPTAATMPPPSNHQYFLPVNEESVVKADGATLYFPQNALYENLYMKFHISNNLGSSNTFSPTFHAHDYLTPVHSAFKIGIRADNLPPDLAAKAFVGYCRRSDASILNIGGKLDPATGLWTARYDKFGNFCLMVDQSPPRVNTVNFPEKVNGQNGRISFKINDNFDAAGPDANDLKFRATIDDQWILMEYDKKNDLILHRFSDEIEEGEHQFRLVVTDHCGNETVVEKKFTIDDDAAATSPKPKPKSSSKSSSKSKPAKKKKK